MARFAVWVNSRLLSYDVDGTVGPPGYGAARRWVQPNGSEVLIVNRGPAVDMYVGKKNIMNFSFDAQVIFSIARWVLWLWVVHTWCGVKTWVWNLSLAHILKDRNVE